MRTTSPSRGWAHLDFHIIFGVPVHSQIPPILLSLTQIVLLNIADVAVDRRVAKNDQHNSIAPFCLDAVRRMTLHRINLGRLDDHRVSPLPRPTWHVEHPQFICHIPSAAFQFPAKHVDLILKEMFVFSTVFFKMMQLVIKLSQSTLH